MPRRKIELPGEVDYLSILDEDDTLDEELEPSIADDKLLKMHRVMLLARRFDERMLSLQRQGRIGTFAPVKGQEAAQVGSAAALTKDDWLVPAFRESAVSIWRGAPLSGLLLYNAGYNEGGAIPEGQNDLPIAVPVASQIPHAAGIGYAMKYRQDEAAVMVYFGDGATSEGDFHEALNFAGVFEIPAVFLCQNNQWAISIPREQQTKSKTLAQKALAYGIPGIQVDGNDVLATYTAAQEALERAWSGDGATMIECVTYRLEVHTTADDPSKYREDEEVKEWQKRDPLPRFQRYLIEKDLTSKDEIDSLETEIEAEIDSAWKETQEKMEELDDPLVIFDHCLAETPPYLEEQREEMKQFLGRNGGKESG